MVVEEKGLFVIFGQYLVFQIRTLGRSREVDMAYQGFESGSAEEDAWPIRLFAERDIELMVSAGRCNDQRNREADTHRSV